MNSPLNTFYRLSQFSEVCNDTFLSGFWPVPQKISFDKPFRCIKLGAEVLKMSFVSLVDCIKW